MDEPAAGISLTLAALAFLLTFPLMLLIALFIRITSSGPVLLREPRAGFNGSTFDLYRFRCVYLTEGRRPTPLGSLLRKLHLDGLPQLLNVLRRDMSLVGPRAMRPEFAARLGELIPFYRQRHMVRPGLTGWAQVNANAGAAEEDALAALEYDLHYIRNLSPAFDLLILLSAARATFGRG